MRSTERRQRVGASAVPRADDVDGALGRHQIIGHMNPHCSVCGRTSMQIAKNPSARCRRVTLPFDDAVPTLAKATLTSQQKAKTK